MFETMWAWAQGDLSREARIWTALAPALVGTVYFLGGLVLFCVRCLFKGVPVDAETVQRGATKLVGPFLRHYFFWVIRPFWVLIAGSGLPANAFTLLATLMAMASGIAVAAGRFALGGWLFLISGMLDVMDGRVARTQKTAGPAGAALDSVLDRYADSAILIGLSWYYRDTWVLLVVLAAFMGTSVVPYVRAKGESLGVPVKGGMMQRLERVLFLGGGMALSPVLEALVSPDQKHPMHWLAVGGLVFVSVMSNVTGVHRLIFLVSALTPKTEQHRARGPVALVVLNGLAAVVATAVDFGCVLACVEILKLPPAVGTALGCVVGGVLNYALNRVLTFRSHGAVAPQLARYALLSATSAGLNTAGVALLSLFPGLSYAVGWWVVRAVVWLAWNLPLQREYVFRPALSQSHAAR